MGKKSRRQREKDPGSGLRKTLRGALTADTPLGNLSPQELRKLANEVLDSQDPTRAHDDDDDDSELDAVQDAAPAASKPTVAEAEAEFRATASPAGFRDVRFQRAAISLQDAITTDEDDRKNFEYYMEIVAATVPGPGTKTGYEKLLKAIKRWPRYRNYWPRLRRRFCWGCGKQYALSEPRIWVCGGCDEARYCDEACQAAHWPEHKSKCVEKMMGKLKLVPGMMDSVRKLFDINKK